MCQFNGPIQTDGSARKAWGIHALVRGDCQRFNGVYFCVADVVDVVDLLLGTALRLDNASDGHYYSSIGRLGRAMAESNDSSLIETRLLNMIEDSTLDNYNRILMFYLYRNVTYYMQDPAHKKRNLAALKQAMAWMPEPLVSSIKWDD